MRTYLKKLVKNLINIKILDKILKILDLIKFERINQKQLFFSFYATYEKLSNI
jgi:hypothetical protein